MGKRRTRRRKPPVSAVFSDEPERREVEAPKGKKARAEPKRALVGCPACGGSGTRRRGSEWASCKGCGALFRKERPSSGQVAKMREKLFDRAFALPNHEERRQARALAGEAMRGFFGIRTGKPAALNAFGKHVLEVNCGLGFRLRAFQDYGWTAAGTETSATAFEYARRQSLDVRHGWLDEGRFGTTRFDLVLFCATFGKIPDPRKAVEKLRELLTPDGLICVLREPLAFKGAKPPEDPGRLCLHSADSLKRAFCQGSFSFVSEEVHDDETGTFWFRAKAGGSR